MNLTANKFCLENAQELVLYARMAYDEPPTVQSKVTDTQVLIRDLGDCIVVSPRGTSNLRDFITDGKAWRVKTPIGEIHAGGWEAWSSVRDDVCHKLPPQSSSKPILFGAHSLGGMISNIAMKELRDLFFNVHSGYTFGCPRSGNNVFQQQYNATAMPGSPFDNLGDATFGLIHDCDLVPRIPPWHWGYRRPGHDEFLSPLLSVLDGKPCIAEDPSVVIRLESDLWSLGHAWLARRNWLSLDEVIIDHRVDNYISALGAVLPQANAFESALSVLNK